MRQLTKCVVCNRKVDQIIDMGELYNSVFVDSPTDKEKFKPVKTVVNWCKNCKNMQSNYVEDGELMFRDYYYRSNTNPEMVRQLKDIVQSKYVDEVCNLVLGEALWKNPEFDERTFSDMATVNWLDIASNNNTMLTIAKETLNRCFTVGIDPSKIQDREECDIFINDFFSARAIREQTDKKFHIISCIAMMYDIEKIHEFIDDVKSLMAENGIFIVQLMDLESRIKTYAIDDIVNEHLVCYSLECLKKLFKQHGMDIFDCEYNKTNCSSLRIYVCNEGQREIRENVDQMILFQSKYLNADNMIKWYDEVKTKLKSVHNFIKWMKNNNRKIVLIGASTKATPFLQCAELDSSLIDCATELLPFKFGKYMMASGIPIVSETEFLKENDGQNVVFVIAIWAFKNGIVKNYQKQINNGAIVVVPFPSPHIVEKAGEFSI